MRISASTARRLAIRCQGLDGQWRLPGGKEGVAQAIERLGYVQIDTIAVVQRAHHHTIWCRCPDYAPPMLHELQAQDRRVFEYWGPAASYLPIRDYRYYLPRMRASAQRPRTRQWLERNHQLVEHVLDRIRAEGPLRSADFKAPEGFKRGTWWSWKPAKRALEVLFSMGDLMVTQRRGFQRVYDLTERVLPTGTDMTEPDPDELARFEIRRVLGGLGIATAGEISEIRWGIGSRREAISDAIPELSDSGEVTQLEVEGLGDDPYYALTQTLEETTKGLDRPVGLHILSPFDNLAIRRRWLAKVFDFDFTLECYLPRAKRCYGYFCLPILWGDRFAGRLDSKADRKPKIFIVRQMTFEPGFADHDGLLPSLAEKLHDFAAFNGCEQVVVERTDPEKARAALVRQVGIGS